MKFGGQAFWHHLTCFAGIRAEYGFFLSGEKLPGFKSLSEEDQDTVKKAIPAAEADGTKAKKAKREKKSKVNLTLEETIAAQNIEYFDVRDSIQNVPQADLKKFLILNGSGIANDAQFLLDRSADFLTFGALNKCTRCDQGDLIFSKHGYSCNGMENEWVECSVMEEKPLRKKCRLTGAIKEKFPGFKSKVQDRAVRPGNKVVVIDPAKEDEEKRRVKVERQREPLYNFHVVAIGTLSTNRPELKAKIEKMGGKLVTKLQKMIAVVISNELEVEKMNKRMREVESLDIQVVGEDFLDKIVGGSPLDTMEKIKEMSICDWGSDPMLRMPPEEIKGPRVS